MQTVDLILQLWIFASACGQVQATHNTARRIHPAENSGSHARAAASFEALACPVSGPNLHKLLLLGPQLSDHRGLCCR